MQARLRLLRTPIRIVCAVLLAALACSRKTPEGIDRLAILPIADLSGDPALRSSALAIQHVLARQLSGSASLHALAVPAISDAYRARARRVLHGYLTGKNDAIRLSIRVEDLASHKIVAATEASGAAADQLAIIDNIARQLAPDVRPFDTKSTTALHLYAEGMRGSEPALLERSIEADPGFGSPYVSAAQLLITRGNRAEAEAVIRRGMERGDSIGQLPHAQLRLLDASLRQDFQARADAAAEVARALPADPAAARAAAQFATLGRQYPLAVEWYGRALKLEPEEADLWNQLGYAEAYSGNLEGARAALLEYGRRNPKNPNAFDSLGETHYMLGDFAGAEKYFLEAARMDPNFIEGAPLWKAAHARLLTGDIAGADTIANRYFDFVARNKDPLVEYRRVCWDYAAGRRTAALERPPAGPGRGLVHAQRAIWRLAAGELAAARQEAKEAAATAQEQRVRSAAAVTLFLTQPPASVDEWKSRAAKAFPASGDVFGQRFLLAYALLLGRHFTDAAQLFEQVRRSSPPGPARTPDFALGWALVESGRVREAAPHVATYPVPQSGSDIFNALVIPRLLRFQARVLETEGKQAQAAERLRIFEKLGG